MDKLPFGKDSTIGNWLKLSDDVFGQDSGASIFLKDLAKKYPKRKFKKLLDVDTKQFLWVLIQMNYAEVEKQKNSSLRRPRKPRGT